MSELPPFVVNTDPKRVAESQTALITGIITAVHALALLVVIARTYIRLFITRSPGAQDVLMVLSACTALVATIILYMQIPYGLGKHVDTINLIDLVTFGKYSFIHTVVALLGGIGLLKIAIALELMKYNGNSWRWYNIMLWCLIAFVIAYTFEAWMSFILFCRPVAKQWDQSIDGTCYSFDMFLAFALANTTFNIFTDIAFATLPVPIVWKLKMPLKTRIYLVGVLSLGYVAVAMGLIKAVSQVRFDPTGDTTYLYNVQFWGLLQLNVGIIAACAPSLKPLVKNALGLKSLTHLYGYNRSGQNQRSIPLSNVGKSDNRSVSRRDYSDWQSNTSSDGKAGQSNNAVLVRTVFELRSSSQETILDAETRHRG